MDAEQTFEMHCEFCGKLFLWKAKHGREKVFCTTACRRERDKAILRRFNAIRQAAIDERELGVEGLDSATWNVLKELLFPPQTAPSISPPP